MANISLRFESLNENDDLQYQAEVIEERLKGLNTVDDVEAEVEEEKRFTGLEVVGAISVGIAIVGKSEEFVAALRRLIPEIKKLAQDLGLSKVTINLAGKRILLADLEGMSDKQVTHPD